MTDRLLSSTEAAAWLGASPTSVKRWADAGLIECVRTVGNHRRFTLESLEAFSQSRGGPTITTAVSEWLTILLERNVDAVHGQLLLERSNSESWAEVCDRISPVIIEVGEAWASGAIRVVDEHLASERLRRALARVVDSFPTSQRAPAAMLMAVEGDEHTLGLALAEVAMREAGWATLWSGRGTPLDSLSEIMIQRNVRMLAVSASTFSKDEVHLERQLGALERACDDARATLVIGGEGAWPDRASTARRVSRFRQMARVAREVLEEVI